MVDLLPTDDQRAIVAGLARYLDAELPARRLVGAASDLALADDLWCRTAAMGWFGLSLPEAAGGAGLSIVEEMLVFREFGRILAPPAFLGAALGAKAAAGAGNAALAAAITSGQAKVALGLPTDGKYNDLFLLDGAAADYVLCAGTSRANLYRRDQLELHERCTGIDETVEVHRAKTRGDDAIVVEGPEIHRQALILTAASLVGISVAVRDMAVDYAKMREQFGQPIGTFQAIKHRCADMAVRSEAAGAQVAFAAVAVRDGRVDSTFQAISAKLVAGAYAIASAQENIQVHGAIGVTAELTAHLFLKRAHVLDLCFGAGRDQTRRLMACAAAQMSAA